MIDITKRFTPGAAGDVAKTVTEGARKLWRHPVVLSTVGAILLVSVMDAKAISGEPKAVCTRGQIAVSVPGVHVFGVIDSVVRTLPFTRRAPAIRDVVAAQAPDIAISAVVKANGLSGPMDTVPSNYGGIRCLTLPRATKVAQEALVLPGPVAGAPAAPLSVVPSHLAGNAVIGERLATAHGWTGQQWTCLYTLWDHESEWRETAKNPKSTAYGVAQFLDGTWSSVGGRKTADAREQIVLGIRYIDQRYGTPCNAWDFWWNVAPHRPPFNGHWY